MFELEWFKKSGMIVNIHKYQTIIIDRRRSNLTNMNSNVDNQVMSDEVCRSFQGCI